MLVGLEIFVIPGFGVAGISGIVLIVASLALAMVDNVSLIDFDGSLNLRPIIRPVGLVIISATSAIFGSVWLVRKLFTTRSFDHIALRQEMLASEGFTGVLSGLEQYVGQEVIVFTDLKPSGKVKCADGNIVEGVMRNGDYAAKGEKLIVISTEQGRLYCE